MRLLYFRSDIRSVLFIVLAIASYAVQWLGLLRHPALFAASLGLAFIACIIDHNHQHHPTFVPRSLNSAFGVLISLAMGIPATAIIPLHHSNHHVHNNGPDDVSRASIVRFRWNLLNLLFYPFVVVAGFASLKAQHLKAWRSTRPRLYRQYTLERMVVYPTFVLLLVIRPLEALLYFGVPYLFGQWAIVAMNHLQHFDCDPNSEYDHSRNIVGHWANWWFFNNGLHTAHHLKPALHWSLLPAFHGTICQKIDPRLLRESVLGTLWKLYVLPACVPGLERTHSASEADSGVP